MNRETFFDRIHGLVDPSELIMVSHAYWLAKQVHREQVRDSGERYFEHCRRVALNLVGLPSVTASDFVLSFVHDCIEDGFMPPGLLRAIFGDEMAHAVAAISKSVPVYDEHSLTVISRRKKSIDDYFAGIRKAPVFVGRVKCADRLDNLRSMGVWTVERKKKYLLETEQYILPLAREVDHMLAVQLEDEWRTCCDLIGYVSGSLS
ncbi:MAG: HD domain-containing protein [bacterium]|nr:HD domain-containing protein [bacterium]MDZ4285681.1 HD domain-containing protein [Candidatus Sungbacteria bacterium]